MKKFFVLVFVALMVFAICVLPVMAHAEPPATEAEQTAQEIVADEPEPTPGQLPTEFTWKYLVTTGGTAILVYFIVQYAKAPLDKVGHIPTRLLVYILCLVSLLVSNAFLNHGLKIETAALCVFNALISAYAAYGMYEVWIRKKENAV